MQINFSPSAEKDLLEIYSYLKREDIKLAKETLNRIKISLLGLIDFPKKGRIGLAHDTRELVIPNLPYYVPYKIEGNSIYILRIYHSSRRPIVGS